MASEKTRRVFFALWPDDGVRKQLVNTFNASPQSKLNGHLIRPENLHITLHFIGNVSEEKLTCLDEAARTVSVEPFELQIDRYGHFYKAKIFWMGCHQIPPVLYQLHQQLGESLSDCDYQIEKRPYAPHVSMMRKLTKPGELTNFTSIDWQVNDFVLVESITRSEGVEYKVIRKYPF